MECRHRRYSIDVKEQTGHCIDCGAEGRMRFVVPLTGAQIEELKDDGTFLESCRGIVRAIEEMHGIVPPNAVFSGERSESAAKQG